MVNSKYCCNEHSGACIFFKLWSSLDICLGVALLELMVALKTINAGESVEKREPLYTVGGNVSWYGHYGEQHGASLKTDKTSGAVVVVVV